MKEVKGENAWHYSTFDITNVSHLIPEIQMHSGWTQGVVAFRILLARSLCLSVNVPFYLNSKVNGQVDIQLRAEAKG